MSEFEELGLLEKIEDHGLTVPYGDRSGVVIEPLLTDQWYVRVAPLAEPAKEAVKNGDIKFVPQAIREHVLFVDERRTRLVYFTSALVGSPYSSLVR